VAWCEREGRQSLPASPDTVAAWMVVLADGHDGGAPPSASTISVCLSAVVSAHRAAGYSLDRRHPLIAEIWAGITQAKAKTHAKRRAPPIMDDDPKSLLQSLQPSLPADARDAALLALKRGEGTGWIHIEEGKGLVITLPTSKASQAEAVTVIVPRADMPIALEAVEGWANVAKLKAGEPVFRPIDKGQRIGSSRLTDRRVALIVKARIRELAQAKGKTREEAEDLVRQFSGHSMRAGYATTAGAKDLPSYRIMQHTRHRTHETVAGYIREGQKWAKSGLKGIGF
jgi:hypothetical protein